MRLIGNINELPSGHTISPDDIVKPRACALLPDRTTDPEGFFTNDTSCPMCDIPHFLSAAAVRECGHQIGMLDAAELDDLVDHFTAEIEKRDEQIADLRARVEKTEELEKARLLVAAADKE